MATETVERITCDRCGEIITFEKGHFPDFWESRTVYNDEYDKEIWDLCPRCTRVFDNMMHRYISYPQTPDDQGYIWVLVDEDRFKSIQEAYKQGYSDGIKYGVEHTELE